jgi:hypothetical protein
VGPKQKTIMGLLVFNPLCLRGTTFEDAAANRYEPNLLKKNSISWDYYLKMTLEPFLYSPIHMYCTVEFSLMLVTKNVKALKLSPETHNSETGVPARLPTQVAVGWGPIN